MPSASLLFRRMQHHPVGFLLDAGIDFVVPHSLISAGFINDLRQGFVLALASQSIWPRYIYRLCVVPSYVFVLVAPEFLSVREGIGRVARLLVGRLQVWA